MSDFGAALRESAALTLEAMFFVTDLEECDPAVLGPGAELAMRVDFTGSPSGSLTLRAGLRTARSLAADFLGEDEDAISPQQAAETLAEMANMICGAVLTRTENSSQFHLAPPRAIPPEEAMAAEGAAYAVALGGGPLAVRFMTERG